VSRTLPEDPPATDIQERGRLWGNSSCVASLSSLLITAAPVTWPAMARTSVSSIHAQLPSLLSPDTRVAALRTLKNELIGHDEKKELWVRSGVLKPLATVMTSFVSPDMRTHKRAESRSEQEEARLQAIIIVGSLAQGSYDFLIGS